MTKKDLLAQSIEFLLEHLPYAAGLSPEQKAAVAASIRQQHDVKLAREAAQAENDAERAAAQAEKDSQIDLLYCPDAADIDVELIKSKMTEKAIAEALRLYDAGLLPAPGDTGGQQVMPAKKRRRRAKDDVLVDASTDIDTNDPRGIGAVGYSSKILFHSAIPYRKPAPGATEHEKQIGNLTISMLAPSKVGLPYGATPRLILAWVMTEAVRTKSRHLKIGESLAQFLRALGKDQASGGQNGSITQVKRQMRSLFGTTITVFRGNHGPEIIENARFFDKSSMFWLPLETGTSGLWENYLVLSEEFFKSITDRPFPLDMRALRGLSDSPVELDIYIWLIQRVFPITMAAEAQAKKKAADPAFVVKPISETISWPALHGQFGAGYSRMDNFKTHFRKCLNNVQMVYPALVCNLDNKKGLTLRPSPLAVGPRLDKAL